jgi:uncharacterized membrane protein
MARLGGSGSLDGMLDLIRAAALIAATVTTGLMAGLFYAYSISVMPALGRSTDRTFVEGMQRINVAILNGWFAICFGGGPVFITLAAALHLGAEHRSVLVWTAAALVLYAAMLVITFRINVPLNNELDAAGDPDKITDLAAVRRRFEATWVRWNIVRTVANTAAFGCLTWALVLFGRTVS